MEKDAVVSESTESDLELANEESNVPTKRNASKHRHMIFVLPAEEITEESSPESTGDEPFYDDSTTESEPTIVENAVEADESVEDAQINVTSMQAHVIEVGGRTIIITSDHLLNSTELIETLEEVVERLKRAQE